MSFDHPYALLLFAIFIPIFIFDIITGKNKINLTAPLKARQKASVFFFRVFLACSIIAIACPRWGTSFTVSEFRRGIDIVFAIDVSRSMDIRDAQHHDDSLSRLEQGLNIAIQTVHNVSGARFAAAVGRGRASLAVPLTWSNEATLSFLESLDVSSVTGRSTNLEALIDAASSAFVGSSPANRIIVLLSDGEAHFGSIERALGRSAAAGIMVNAVALGSDAGRLILSEANNPQSPMVTSRRDANTMRKAGEITGGIFIDGSRDDAAVILSNHLLSVSHEIGQGRSRTETRERRTLFIVLAILSIGLSRFIPRLPFGKKRFLNKAPLAALAAILLFFTGCSEEKLLLIEANYFHSRGRYDEAIASYLRALNFENAAPYAEYGLGLTFFLMGEGQAALARFENSLRMLQNLPAGEHRELRFRNNYNSGIILFEEGDYHRAVMFFRQALREDPRRIEAKRNLELSLMSLARQPWENIEEQQVQNEKHEILFDYIRQEEQNRWQSQEWSPEEEMTPDW